METIKKPSLVVVGLYYIFAIGMFVLFAPSVYFYWTKVETNGIVYKMDLPETQIKYYDETRKEHVVATKEEYRKSKLNLNDKVKVYYRKGAPKDVHLPGFEGNEPYLLHHIFLLMAMAVVFMMQMDYLKK